MKYSKKTFTALLSIIIIGAFLRFYKLPEMTQFEFDQEYAANFAYSVLNVYPIQLIGQGLSVKGLFMGPLYFYYLVPFYFLTNMHPLGGAIGSVVLGLFTIAIYFFVGRSIFGSRVGLLLAFLRATLYSFVNTDRLVTPAFSSDSIIILTWYCFYQYWHGKTIFVIPTAILFGLYTSFHPILFPFYFVFVAMVVIKRKLPSMKHIVLSIIAGIVPILPLIKFEIDHKFLEFKVLFAMSSENITHEVRDLPRLIKHLQIELVAPLWNLVFEYRNAWIIPVSFLIIGTGLVAVIKKTGFWKDSFHATMLGVTALIFTAYYFLLPTHVPEYYFLPIHILGLMYVVAAVSLSSPTIVKKWVLPFVCLAIVFKNFNMFTGEWNNPNLKNLSQKDAIIKQVINHTQNNSAFFVSYIMPYGDNTGYPYLFKIYNRTPSNDVSKPIFNIVYPKASITEKHDFSAGNIGLILPKNLTP